MRNQAIYTAPCHRGPRTVSVLGLPILSERRSVCEGRLSALLKSRGGSPALIFTPNVEMLASAKGDPKYRALLRSADLLLPDGIGVLLLSRFRVKERLPGIEMGEFLLSEAERQGCSVYLLGGKPGVAEAAARRLTARFPALSVVGTHHGYFAPESEAESALTEAIRTASPALLIVCMGFPRQEEFLLRIKKALPTLRVGIGLGGSLDVWSGRVRRAPKALRAVGIEWLWRIMGEPKRIPRLLKSLTRIL